jgi:hypothetical protein
MVLTPPVNVSYLSFRKKKGKPKKTKIAREALGNALAARAFRLRTGGRNAGYRRFLLEKRKVSQRKPRLRVERWETHWQRGHSAFGREGGMQGKGAFFQKKER